MDNHDDRYNSEGVVMDGAAVWEKPENGGLAGQCTADSSGQQQETTRELRASRRVREMSKSVEGVETEEDSVHVVRLLSTAVSTGWRDDNDTEEPDITSVPDVFPASYMAQDPQSPPVPVQSSTCIRLSVSGAAGLSSSQASIQQTRDNLHVGNIISLTASTPMPRAEDRREGKKGGSSSVSTTEEGPVCESYKMCRGEDAYNKTGDSREKLTIYEQKSDVCQSTAAYEPEMNLQDLPQSKASDSLERPLYDTLEGGKGEKALNVTDDGDIPEGPSTERSSAEASYACDTPTSPTTDPKSSSEPGVPGQATFRSQVVMQLATSKAMPQIRSAPEEGREPRAGASEGLGLLSSPTSDQQSHLWDQQGSSDEGTARGKRADANGPGGLGLKEVEFKLDIGKRRLPSPDVKRVSVEKERAPEFVVKPRRQFVDEGQNAKFKVACEGSPSPSLSWSRNGKSLDPSKKFKIYEEGGYHFLEVCDVTQADSGMYVGTIHNTAGTDTASAELDVFEKPKLLTRGSPPPTLTTSLQDMDVVIGDRDIKLTCEVKGGDRCTATWFHNGRELRQGRQHRCTFTGQTASLTVTEVGEEDGGEYRCVVKNTNGEVSTSCTVSTQEGEKREPPVFIKELQDLEVEDGDKVELIVEVKGSQPVQVYWMHNNQQLTVDTPGFVLRTVDGVHSLLIPRANSSRDGEYVCEAYNDYGDTDTFCRLRVKDTDLDNEAEP